jgi:hypothetical protein
VLFSFFFELTPSGSAARKQVTVYLIDSSTFQLINTKEKPVLPKNVR